MPAWAWGWTLEVLRHGLKNCLRYRTFSPQPGGVLDRERRWWIANLITGRGRHSNRAVEANHLLDAIDRRFAGVPEGAAGVTFADQRGRYTAQELHQLGTELREGKSTIDPPWQPPDLSPETLPGGWIWSDYSPAALLQRTQQVYQGALDAYTELVTRYFPAWKPTLSLAATLPVQLRGVLKPTSGDDSSWPVLSWYVVPLPPASESHAQIEIGHPDPVFGHLDARRTRARGFAEKLRRWRPEGLPYAAALYIEHGEKLGIFGARPATSLAYEWLADDLHRLGWIRSKLGVKDHDR